MPDPAVRLDTTRLSAAPGGQVSVVVTIRNMGQIVEGFTVEALGDPAAAWATLPDEIPVYPQQEATAVVVFSVPDGVGAASGLDPVRAAGALGGRSGQLRGRRGRPRGHAVVGLQPVLRPVTSKGRWRGRHEIQVTNWGNAPARLRLSGERPGRAARPSCSPRTSLEVPLGGTGRAKISVRTRQPFLRGTADRLPFQVVADSRPAGSTPPTASGRVRPGAPDRRRRAEPGPDPVQAGRHGGARPGSPSVGGVVYLVTHHVEGRGRFANTHGRWPRQQLKAQPGSDSITLTWDPVDGVDGY